VTGFPRIGDLQHQRSKKDKYIYLLRDDIFISKMLQIHHHETDHRKQVTRLGIPFRPEHPYETHARLLLL
ncbi:hypothetical protein AADQ08_25400, partial [Escherichia coli]|nr:hypothetical protein [Shigella sonnei]